MILAIKIFAVAIVVVVFLDRFNDILKFYLDMSINFVAYLGRAKGKRLARKREKEIDKRLKIAKGESVQNEKERVIKILSIVVGMFSIVLGVVAFFFKKSY